MSKSKKNSDPQEIANEVYNTIGQAVFSTVENKGYLQDEDKLYATAYSLVSLAADLLAQATKMEETDIFASLAEVLADSLDIEFKLEAEKQEVDSILELPKESHTKKMIN